MQMTTMIDVIPMMIPRSVKLERSRLARSDCVAIRAYSTKPAVPRVFSIISLPLISSGAGISIYKYQFIVFCVGRQVSSFVESEARLRAAVSGASIVGLLIQFGRQACHWRR